MFYCIYGNLKLFGGGGPVVNWSNEGEQNSCYFRGKKHVCEVLFAAVLNQLTMNFFQKPK